MTVKSRRRKLYRRLHKAQQQPEMSMFHFSTGTREVSIEAEDERQAKQKFQERFGFWPDPA